MPNQHDHDTYGRAAIKAKQKANSKSGADDPAQNGALYLAWVNLFRWSL